jgi:hypothetical protein
MRYNRGMMEIPLPLAPQPFAPVPAPDDASLLEQLATLQLENAALRAQHAFPARAPRAFTDGQDRHQRLRAPQGDEPARLPEVLQQPESVEDTALKDWSVFLHAIRRHSGKHHYQGGLAIFVVEGEGYPIVNGERTDWEAGDLILLPIIPEGCEHQHFNRHADQSCKWLAFIYKPMHDEVASYIEQKESMPTGQA